MNEQLPAIILIMIAMIMFGAFEEYQVPWIFQFLGVLIICGIPLIIIVIDSCIKKRKSSVRNKPTRKEE